MPSVFLDHQSSTPLLPEAWDAMQPYFLSSFGNPSSLHQHGIRARQAIQRARTQFAALVGASSPDEIIFTSGGTEAANLAMHGVAWAHQRRGKHLVVSAVEHPAILNAAAFLQKLGFSVTRVAVDQHGAVDPDRVRAALTGETILICVQHANHDIGTLQPIAEIGALAQERGVPLLVDAIASAGWLPLDVEKMGISLLSLTAHRFYGPKGVGVLYRHRRVSLTSLIHGGDQERGFRAGTENVPAIVGGGVAAEVALREMDKRREHVGPLQRRLWTGLKQAASHVALHGFEPGPRRIYTNLNVSAEFTEGEGQLLALDMAGVAVASGTSCVTRSLAPSPVLEAMGVDRAVALASVIFSLGKDNTDEEIDGAVAAYTKVVKRLRGMSTTWEEYQKGMLPSWIEAQRLSRADSSPITQA